MCVLFHILSIPRPDTALLQQEYFKMHDCSKLLDLWYINMTSLQLLLNWFIFSHCNLISTVRCSYQTLNSRLFTSTFKSDLYESTDWFFQIFLDQCFYEDSPLIDWGWVIHPAHRNYTWNLAFSGDAFFTRPIIWCKSQPHSGLARVPWIKF